MKTNIESVFPLFKAKELKLVFRILSFQVFLQFNVLIGQYIVYPIPSDSGTVCLKVNTGKYGFGINITNYRSDLKGSNLIIKNVKGSCKGAIRIHSDEEFISMNGMYSQRDTFIIYLISHTNDLIYPAEVFKGKGRAQKVTLGKTSCRLKCVPENNPWMPVSDYEPFLFDKKGYYVNPSTGKINKGRYLLNGLQVSACSLEYWGYIHAFSTYTNREGKRVSGKYLIKQRKIDLSQWNFSEFNLDWCL